MKVKDLLENYQGDNYIEIYDCFSWQTKGFNNNNKKPNVTKRKLLKQRKQKIKY